MSADLELAANLRKVVHCIGQKCGPIKCEAAATIERLTKEREDAAHDRDVWQGDALAAQAALAKARETAKMISVQIDSALAYASDPLSRPLEVGFRHSPLTPNERLERYAEACLFIKQDLEAARAALAPEGKP